MSQAPKLSLESVADSGSMVSGIVNVSTGGNPSVHPGSFHRVDDARSEISIIGSNTPAHAFPKMNSHPTTNNMPAPDVVEIVENQNDFGNDLSIMNSYADNVALVDQQNKEQQYQKNMQSMAEEASSNSVGIEIIRLNKKFDIFMKRFMRAEEDIKEVQGAPLLVRQIRAEF